MVDFETARRGSILPEHLRELFLRFLFHILDARARAIMIVSMGMQETNIPPETLLEDNRILFEIRFACQIAREVRQKMLELSKLGVEDPRKTRKLRNVANVNFAFLS